MLKSEFEDRERSESEDISNKIPVERFEGRASLDPYFALLKHPWYPFIDPDFLPYETSRLETCEQEIAEELTLAINDRLSHSIPKSIRINAKDTWLIEIEVENPSMPNMSAVVLNKSKPHILTTLQLTNALDRYMRALAAWETAFADCLEQLFVHLGQKQLCFVAASHASIILAALKDHVTEAQNKGWTLPDISDLTDRKSRKLQIHEFWPYWMEKDTARCNSITLDRMAILTGPNMAGKSTVLRSIAAVCCLGLSGFYVPATSATLLFLDCVNLKTFVTDSPLEGHSAFALEMIEVKHVLHDATSQTLVLIDELGKGTEITGGIALSAAIFKELYNRNAIGLFATHLHKIKRFENDFSEAVYYRIEVETDADGEKMSTWKLIPGFCQESLGLEVAVQQGIPQRIVDRAEALMLSVESRYS